MDAARALHRHSVHEMLDRAARGDAFAPLDRARYRRDKAFITRLCVQAVNRLFEASGARGILESEPIQRFHRDVHGASHHAALGWDVAAEIRPAGPRSRPRSLASRTSEGPLGPIPPDIPPSVNV